MRTLRNRGQALVGGASLGMMAAVYLVIAADAPLLGIPGVLAFGCMTVRALRSRIEIDSAEVRDHGVLRTRRFERDRVVEARAVQVHALPWYAVELDLDVDPFRGPVRLTGAWFWGDRGRHRLEEALAAEP